MFPTAALLAFSYLAVVLGQQVGTNTPETHPTLTSQSCTASGCTTQQTSVVLDSNWRWLHATTGYTNCYTGNAWNATICPDPTTCATSCALDGADYASTYGITTSGDSLTLDFVTTSSQKNVGSRVYLMESETEYQMFSLLNQEFTFTVDMSNLPCGLNGALYFVEMDQDGGMAKYPNNKAGAKYGTGYCDSQCPRDIKFINGAANLLDWTPSTTDSNAGTGMYGTCCNEMDVWEANFNAAAVTPHPCSVVGQTECSGSTCSAAGVTSGVCDQAGCDFNSYRMGNTTFLGQGLTVDTNKPITVVTQFITDDGTATGTLSEIKRFYVQNGVVIPNSMSNIAGVDPVNSITDDFCTQQKTAFGDTNTFASQGGMKVMGEALQKGMVLVLSIWDDYAADMLWLDSDYPTTKSASSPGVARGPCATTSGSPPVIEVSEASASVTFSNIKWGAIGSTTSTTPGSPGGGTTTTTTATTSAPTGSAVAKYGQCGGIGFTGSTTCASGSTCTVVNAYYSQCL